MAEKSSPLFFERYELKFHIPFELVEELSSYVSSYCDLDYYSEISEDKFYTVNNLYLDTPNLLFRERRLSGMDDRFNLRIRSYGGGSTPPYFFEIKHKSHGFIQKKRAKVMDQDWAKNLDPEYYLSHDDVKVYDQNNYLQHFLSLVHEYGASPKVFTQYRRKAYVSNVDDYARVTFDRDLRYMNRTTYDLSPKEAELSHYDHQLNFEDDKNIILELKCTINVPSWFLDMITIFQLKRRSFSKYTTGMNEILFDPNESAKDRVNPLMVGSGPAQSRPRF